MSFIDYIENEEDSNGHWFVGRVERFFDDRGFGFAQPFISSVDLNYEESALKEIFFHFSALNTNQSNATKVHDYILGKYGFQDNSRVKKIFVSKYFLLNIDLSNKGRKELRRFLSCPKSIISPKQDFSKINIYKKLVELLGSKISDKEYVLVHHADDTIPYELFDKTCSFLQLRKFKQNVADRSKLEIICDNIITKDKPEVKCTWIEITGVLPNLDEAVETVLSSEDFRQYTIPRDNLWHSTISILRDNLKKELGRRKLFNISPDEYLDEKCFDISKKMSDSLPTLSMEIILKDIFDVYPICDWKAMYADYGIFDHCRSEAMKVLKKYEVRKEEHERLHSPFWESIHKKMLEFSKFNRKQLLYRAIPYYTSNCDIPIFSIFPYVKRSYQTPALPSEVDIAEMIYSFKDGSLKASEYFFEAILIIAEKEKFVNKPYLFPIPAASSSKNESRYLYFKKFLKSSDIFNNGLDLYRYEGRSSGKHKGGCGVDIEKLFITPSIAGKDVVLFDDVTTSGRTIVNFSSLLKKYGANVVAAITLGKTTTLPEPSLGWYKSTLLSTFEDDKDKINEYYSDKRSDYFIRQANIFVKSLIDSVEFKYELIHDCYIFDMDKTIVDSRYIKGLNNKTSVLEFYSKLPSIKPYDGMLEILKDIRSNGKKVVILSDLKKLYVNTIVSKIKIPNDLIIGDSYISGSKPSLDNLRVIREKLGTSCEVYIGNRITNIEIASHAGIAFLGVNFSADNIFDIEDKAKSVSDLRKMIFGKISKAPAPSADK